MTRRRTSVIGAPRAPLAGPEQVPPQALRQWSAAAVRELVLSADGQLQQEQQRLADTRWRWRIALGRDSGNPEPSSGRSALQRLPRDSKGRVFWLKTFTQDNGAWMANETSVLKHCLDADPYGTLGLRRHVGQMKLEGQSRLVEVSTLDAGPNLGMWQDFAPCTGVGQHALKLPLFSQPIFLAALVRQGLVALHALAPHRVVHGDLKPGNLCLALPEGPGAWAMGKGETKGEVQGRWNLRDLPLRLIDFELGFAGQFNRPHHPGENANMSPYLRACHRAAAGLPNAHDRAEVMGGIDWGADTWALGFMLGEWVAQALAFNTAYLQAFGERWGIGSPAHAAADDTVARLWADLGWLRSFAGLLQAQERPVSDAAQRRLEPRNHAPLRALWGQLEDHFDALNASAPTEWSTVCFSLIDPESPLAEEAGPNPWLTAALRLHQHGSALATRITRASRRTLALATRRPRRLLLAALLLGLPTLAWQARGDVHQATLQLSQRWAPGPLRAFRDSGQSWQAHTGQAWLALAETLQPGQAAAITLAALGDAPVFDEHSPPIDPDALRKLRDASLRDLSQLARLPAPALAQPAANALGLRLLLATYHAGARLETTAPVPLGPGTDGAADALVRLHRVQGDPLAALLQVQLLACHAPADRMAQATPSLDALLALPAGTASRSYYLAFAQFVRARVAAGQPPCLLHPAQAAN